MIPMTQMNRTLIEKILTVCRSPIQKEKLKTNYESSSRKNNTTQEKQQRNPKIRNPNYAKRWLYLQKKQKKILKSNKSEEEKDNFYFKFVSKITDEVTQK